MKILIAIYTVFFISTCFAQQDLFPAYLEEISYNGIIAYYKGSPFTGVLVDKKTNEKIGEFKNGQKNGMFVEYYSKETKKSEGNYINSIKDGIHTEWFENEQIISSFIFNNGKLVVGKYTTYLENGKIEKEESYIDNTLVKEDIYENGQVVNSKELITEFNPNGGVFKKGYVLNGKKDGIWIEYYDTGQKKNEANYDDEMLEGRYLSWYKNGQLESELFYKKGKLDGMTTYWFVNGRIKSKNYAFLKRISKNHNKSISVSLFVNSNIKEDLELMYLDLFDVVKKKLINNSFQEIPTPPYDSNDEVSDYNLIYYFNFEVNVSDEKDLQISSHRKVYGTSLVVTLDLINSNNEQIDEKEIELPYVNWMFSRRSSIENCLSRFWEFNSEFIGKSFNNK